jgi:hypothetical protein
MATRYYSFNIFMDDVIKHANDRVDLEELFAVDSNGVVKIVSLIISKGGWEAFVAVVLLLLMGPIGFSAAILGFASTPVGWILISILGATMLISIRKLYQYRELPIAVKEVGEEFKPKWKEVEGNQHQVDLLVEQASSSLINKASAAQRRLFDL